MTEENELLDAESASDVEDASESDEAVEARPDREPMPPIESRFMFVDIASLRAAQLRRGALPRVTMASADTDGDTTSGPVKLEHVAIQELKEGLIVYELPEEPKPEIGPDVKEQAS
jgi:DNA-directed RNA polymerase subunit K/omega